jgi:hypothetical protein
VLKPINRRLPHPIQTATFRTVDFRFTPNRRHAAALQSLTLGAVKSGSRSQRRPREYRDHRKLLVRKSITKVANDETRIN